MEIQVDGHVESSRQPMTAKAGGAHHTHDNFLTPLNNNSRGGIQRSFANDTPTRGMNIHDNDDQLAQHLEAANSMYNSSNTGVVSQTVLPHGANVEPDNFEVTNQRGFVIRGLKPVKTPLKPMTAGNYKRHSQAQSPMNGGGGGVNVTSNRDLEEVGADH